MRRGLTLPEIMVAVVLISAVFLMVANVFSTASNVAGRTLAHNEILDAANTFERTVRDDLASLAPGWLMIYAPNVDGIVGFVPTDLRIGTTNDLTDFADVAPFTPSGQGVGVTTARRPTRADEISFLSAGREHQSWWYGVQVNVGGVSGLKPLTRPEALVHFGHGLDPATNNTTLPPEDAFHWNFSRRAVLLGAPTGAPLQRNDNPGAPQGGIARASFTYDALLNNIRDGLVDAIEPTAEEVSQEIERLRNVSNGNLDTFLTSVFGLFARNSSPEPLAPPALPPGLAKENYFRRNCFRFMPRVGSVIVEWTDGSPVDPRQFNNSLGNLTGVAINPAVQWFGQPRDVNGDGDLPAGVRTGSNVSRNLAGSSNTGDLDDPEDVMSYVQYYNLWYASSIAPAPPRLPPLPIDYIDVGGSYAAFWTRETWPFRPKAVRFVVRFYDPNQRITNVEPWPPRPGTAQQVLEKRFGLEFSIVVALP